jgi:hypothetical protein
MIALALFSLFLPALQPAEQTNVEDGLLRVVYEVILREDRDTVLLTMVLNQAAEDHLSIHCIRSPAGGLFTYWATPESDTLYFPKSKQAFVGHTDVAFEIFPDGPRLTRERWLGLLFREPPQLQGRFFFRQDLEWRVLTRRDLRVEIRWREKRRAHKKHYSQRVLEPTFRDGTEVRQLREAKSYDFEALLSGQN